MINQDEQLVDELFSALAHRTISVAESLTGGLVCATLTQIPGASRFVRGGVVVYSTDLKHSLAGVPEELLATHGPVSRATAEAMAVGVAKTCDSTYGLALTGVAGPDLQDGHPVGTVFIAIAEIGKDSTVCHIASRALNIPAGEGTPAEHRNVIRHESVTAALQFATEFINSDH